jgi:hypothetical protein
MAPTPPSHSSLVDGFRFRSRRQRNAHPYDPSQRATPTQAHGLPPVTPLVDEAEADGEGEEDASSGDEVEDEDDDEDDHIEGDIDDEAHDVEEEEGGIEEGL